MVEFEFATYGDLMSSVQKCKTQRDAEACWKGLIAWYERPDAKLMGHTPEEVAVSNVGYLLGYMSDAEAARIAALFPKASHPIFGPEFGRGYKPTDEEAFAAGEAITRGDP